MMAQNQQQEGSATTPGAIDAAGLLAMWDSRKKGAGRVAMPSPQLAAAHRVLRPAPSEPVVVIGNLHVDTSNPLLLAAVELG